MRASQQLYLSGFDKLKIKEFGGALLKGNPREARPVSTKRPMHLVMRSTHAKGAQSFLHPSRAKKIDQLIRKQARAKGFRLYRYANSGNHLHLIILPVSIRAYHSFIKAISGLIARITLGAERGRAQGLKFWDARPWTRILEWGREFGRVARYILQNKLEAIGFIPYIPRKIKRALN